MKTYAIILAAGSGSRMGGKVKKQYMELGGKTVLYHAIKAFENSPIDEIYLVASKDDVEEVSSIYMGTDFTKVKGVTAGGRERYNSVYAGLDFIQKNIAHNNVQSDDEEERYVFIHDGARPFVDNEIILRCLEGVKEYKACVAAMPSKDTVKIADEDGFVVDTPDRRSVWNMQTPQCFDFDLILNAYATLIEKENMGELGGLHITDDAQVCEQFTGQRIKLVEGSYKNIKITTPEDMMIGEMYLKKIK